MEKKTYKKRTKTKNKQKKSLMKNNLIRNVFVFLEKNKKVKESHITPAERTK